MEPPPLCHRCLHFSLLPSLRTVFSTIPCTNETQHVAANWSIFTPSTRFRAKQQKRAVWPFFFDLVFMYDAYVSVYSSDWSKDTVGPGKAHYCACYFIYYIAPTDLGGLTLQTHNQVRPLFHAWNNWRNPSAPKNKKQKTKRLMSLVDASTPTPMYRVQKQRPPIWKGRAGANINNIPK